LRRWRLALPFVSARALQRLLFRHSSSSISAIESNASATLHAARSLHARLRTQTEKEDSWPSLPAM
jgi:hypothetical protein